MSAQPTLFDLGEPTERREVHLPVVQSVPVVENEWRQVPFMDLDAFGKDSPFASQDLHCAEFWNPDGLNRCPIVSCRYHMFHDRNGLISAEVDDVAEYVATMPVHCMWDALELARDKGDGDFGAASQEQTAELMGVKRTAYQEVEERTLGIWDASRQRFTRTPQRVKKVIEILREFTLEGHDP